MQHARLFRKLREQRGLTLDALARLARRHRNTIINLESGRPVKFATIARLMEKLGFSSESPEMASMALLWVESVSGVSLSSPGSVGDARQKAASYQRDAHRLIQHLGETIRRSGLDEREIRLLNFAAGRPEVLQIVAAVHDLLQERMADATALKVAENK
jgi:transcriptional regulator with XRE-family HTH domain